MKIIRVMHQHGSWNFRPHLLCTFASGSESSIGGTFAFRFQM